MVVLHTNIQFLGGVLADPSIVPPIRCPCDLRELRVSVVNCCGRSTIPRSEGDEDLARSSSSPG
jgi:hypothetical protein